MRACLIYVLALTLALVAAPAWAGDIWVSFSDAGSHRVQGKVVGQGGWFLRCECGLYGYDVPLATLSPAAREQYERDLGVNPPLPAVETLWIAFTDLTGAQLQGRVIRQGPETVRCLADGSCHDVEHGKYTFIKHSEGPFATAAQLSADTNAATERAQLEDGSRAVSYAGRSQAQSQLQFRPWGTVRTPEERAEYNDRVYEARIESERLEQARNQELWGRWCDQAALAEADRQQPAREIAAGARSFEEFRQELREREELREAARIAARRERQSAHAAEVATVSSSECRDQGELSALQEVARQLELLRQQQDPAYQRLLEEQRREQERLREIQLSIIKHDPYRNSGR